VVECKNDSAFHASKACLKTKDLDAAVLDAEAFAEDGVIHYMRALRKEFNVIGLAISGDEKLSLRLTTFRCQREGVITRVDASAVLKSEQYLAILGSESENHAKVAEDIEDFAQDLHEYLRDEMELSEPEKPLLVSAVLLALSVQAFRKGYRSETTGASLATNLLDTVKRRLSDPKEKLHPTKITLMMHNFGFIQNNTELHVHLHETVIRIERNVWGAVKDDHNIDLLGNFYGEFLKYSGGDKKGLGIVLTPRHITGLFAKIGGLEKDTVLLDPCAGTGGFLIAGMAEMVKKAKMDDFTIEEIKRSQLIGIEQNDRMFTLACANMLLRGDGKSNMFKSSCFDPSTQAKINSKSLARDIARLKVDLDAARKAFAAEAVVKKRDLLSKQIEEMENKIADLQGILDDSDIRKEAIKRPPQVAILNPPYAKKAEDKHELAFIFEACKMLEPGGTCVAIIPMSCALERTHANIEWKRLLLEQHTLLAVMSMPEQLFPMIGVVTCALVFVAHKPNHEDHESWFAYWRDDGFKLKKTKRVEVRPWLETESRWLSAYRKRSVIPQFSVLRHVTEDDEWCAEAYLEPDYLVLTRDSFIAKTREYVIDAFNLSQGIIVGATDSSIVATDEDA
jgi:type I restriction-modification system DNA methylase subunit